MNLPPSGFSKAVLRYEWHCEGCDQVAWNEYTYGPNYGLLFPVVPEGWTEMPGSKFYCPKHQLVILLDGQPLFRKEKS
jgi:hypothetical protein